MTNPEFEVVTASLNDPAATVPQLQAAARALSDAFARRDDMIGILPPGADQVLIGVYRRLDEVATATGQTEIAREAALRWIRESYFRGTDPAGVAGRLDQLAADDPDGEAHVLRGWMRGAGYAYPLDTQAGFHDQEVAASRGNSKGMLELYILLTQGDGVPHDPDQAMGYLEQAAALHNVRAVYNLAAHYALGQGVAMDSSRAFSLYVEAADLGHPRAGFNAGVMALTGDGVPEDAAAAKILFERAEELGYDVEQAATELPSPLDEQVLAIVDAES